MIRCILICPDPVLRKAVVEGLGELHGVEVAKVLDRYPSSTEAGRTLDSLNPQAVFIDTRKPLEVRETVQRLGALSPGLPLIGIDWNITSGSLLKSMNAGLHDFVSAPFTKARLQDVVDRAVDSGAERDATFDSHRVYAFLPSKPGVGASTVAVNTAVALAARNPGQALLMDYDVAGGSIAFALELGSAQADDHEGKDADDAEAVWRAHVRRHGALDVLPNLPHDSAAPANAHHSRLLRMARKRYASTVVDLGGDFDEDTYGILRKSQMVFLVTTPDLPALQLTRERIQALSGEHLSDRVELIVNRAGTVPREKIEDLLGFPVYYEFANNYKAVNTAWQNRVPVSAMADQFKRFAGTISGDPWVREELPPQTWTQRLQGLKRAFSRPVL